MVIPDIAYGAELLQCSAGGETAVKLSRGDYTDDLPRT